MTSQENGPLPDPPDHLSETSKEIWNRVIYKVRTSGRQLLLQTALESYDRALEARIQIAKDGLTWKSKETGAVHLNPLLKVEKESLSLAVRIFNQLGLQHFEASMEAWP